MRLSSWRWGQAGAIGELVAAARREQGLTQRRLAELLGVSQVNVSRIEGGSDMRVSTLVELARALGLEPMLVPKSAVPAVRALLDDLAGGGEAAPERGRFE